MKQKDLIKKLKKGGFTFKRHGSNHDVYVRGTEREEIPRHKEIDEQLAKAILKRRGLETKNENRLSRIFNSDK